MAAVGANQKKSCGAGLPPGEQAAEDGVAGLQIHWNANSKDMATAGKGVHAVQRAALQGQSKMPKQPLLGYVTTSR